MQDIDEEKLRWFLQTANIKRNYPIDKDAPIADALAHLNLLHERALKNAALLLFGKSPQRFHIQAEAKCIHFHGTEVEKPFNSYHIYKGNIFNQVDTALDFVLDRLKNPVIPESGKATTKTPYEIPAFVIREAVVNGLVHRDYSSAAGVQIMVFSDRVEVWNPGGLPPQLTLDSLKQPHPSIPHNPLLAEAFHLTTYIEKAGSGTMEMIKRCRESGLLEPEFEEKMGSFVTTIRRHCLTEEYLQSLGLNERQTEIFEYLKIHKSIKSTEYSIMFNVTDRQARADLSHLVDMHLLKRTGQARLVIYMLNPEISGNIRKTT